MRWSIRWILLSALAGLTLVTVTAILYLNYLSTRDVLTLHARELLSNLASTTIQQSYNYLAPVDRAAALSSRLSQNNVIRRGDESQLEDYFLEQLQSYPAFSGLYQATPTGEFFYVSWNNSVLGAVTRTKIIRLRDGEREVRLIWRDEAGNIVQEQLDPEDNYDPRVRPWYKGALEKGEAFWTQPYLFFTAKKPGITVADVVLDNQGVLDSIIGVDVGLTALSRFVSQLKIGENGRAMIIDARGDVVAHKDYLAASTRDDLMSASEFQDPRDKIALEAFAPILNGDEGGLSNEAPHIRDFQWQGENYLSMMFSFRVAQEPWAVVIWLPEDDYLGRLKAGQEQTIVLAIMLTVLSLLVAAILANFMIRPIRNLQTATRASRDNDLKDYLKPTVCVELAELQDNFRQMLNSIRNYRSNNQALQNDLKASQSEIIMRLGAAAEFKDADTGNHIQRMSRICGVIARQMGLSEHDADMIETASPMHDIGKLGIPDSILNKPGALTSEEWGVMIQHVNLGARLMENPKSELMQTCYDIALTHHEKWDGTGYPNGLVGDSIPISGRIAALADVFDALVSKRCYKPGWPMTKALDTIMEERGKHFDPAAVDALFEALPQIKTIIAEYPDDIPFDRHDQEL